MQVGERVVCIRSHVDIGCSLKKGIIYIINNIHTCVNCNTIMYDVGIGGAGKTLCYCNKYIFGAGWWFDSNRFAPIQYNSVHAELINKLNETKEEKLDVPIKEPEVANE